nr:MAG TPA: hypothetical protein [Caudoviricetes sp.]
MFADFSQFFCFQGPFLLILMQNDMTPKVKRIFIAY